MQTYLWQPWSLFDELERTLVPARAPEWPLFDVEDTDDETVITADLPGVSEDDVEITVSGPYLLVRGERKTSAGHATRRARFHGAFQRRLWIGEGHDPDQVTAHLANGELTIRLAKAAAARPRRIKLTSGGLAAKVKGLLGGEKDKKQAA